MPELVWDVRPVMRFDLWFTHVSAKTSQNKGQGSGLPNDIGKISKQQIVSFRRDRRLLWIGKRRRGNCGSNPNEDEAVLLVGACTPDGVMGI